MCLKAIFHLVPSDQVCALHDDKARGLLGCWKATATASRWLLVFTKRALVVTVDMEALLREAGERARDFGFVARREEVGVLVLVGLEMVEKN